MRKKLVAIACNESSPTRLILLVAYHYQLSSTQLAIQTMTVQTFKLENKNHKHVSGCSATVLSLYSMLLCKNRRLLEAHSNPMADRIPIPVGIPWDPGLSHSHAHLYYAAVSLL